MTEKPKDALTLFKANTDQERAQLQELDKLRKVFENNHWRTYQREGEDFISNLVKELINQFTEKALSVLTKPKICEMIAFYNYMIEDY